MRIDYYSRNVMDRIPLAGCELVQFEYDYTGREVWMVCLDHTAQQEYCLEFHDVLFHSLKSVEDAPSANAVVGIRALEDCVPLEQLRDFQAQKQRKGSEVSSPFLQKDSSLLPVELETTGGIYLIVCISMDFKARRSNKKSETDLLMDLLDDGNSPQIQQKGMELAQAVEYLSIFLRPQESRRLWKNCAIILSRRTDEELSAYVDELFDWAKSADCPGADIIRNRLYKMSPLFLVSAFSRSFAAAKEARDVLWIAALQSFAKERKDFWDLLPENLKVF